MRAAVLLSCIQFASSYSLSDPTVAPSAPSAVEARSEHLPTSSPKEVRAHPPAAEQVPSPSGTGASFLARPSAAPDAVPTEKHPTATPANSSANEVPSALPLASAPAREAGLEASAPEREDGLDDLLEPKAPAPPRLGALAQLRQEPTAFAQLRQEMPAQAKVETSKVATTGEASGSLSKSKSKATELATGKEQAATKREASGSLSKSKSKGSKTKPAAAPGGDDGEESSPKDNEKRTEQKFDGFVTIIFWMGAALVLLILVMLAVCFNKDLLRPRYRRNRQGFEVAKGGGGPSSGAAGVSGKGWGL